MRRLSVKDISLVEHVMLHDDVFPHICDDGTSDKSRFALSLPARLDCEEIFFLSPGDGCVFMLVPFITGAYAVHTCITPEFRGKIGIEYGKKSISYCFKALGMHKIISHIPGYNRRALIYALRCGFRKEGCLRETWKFNNILYNVDIVGITKQEWLWVGRRYH